MRRDGKSLGQMARDEIGPVGGAAALIAVFAIMIILLAVLALVVVNALADSPWGTFSIAMTIPIALFMGFYLRVLRPGPGHRDHRHRRRAAAARDRRRRLGAGLQLGRGVHAGPEDAGLRAWSIYGFFASVLPVWMLLAPRDYLSTFMKIGTIGLLAVGVLVTAPVLQNEAVTKFACNGTGPVFAGSLFPFVFITIACGALSGFHALIASGTTPKMIQKESQVRLIGYGGMLMESFVAVMAMIAASHPRPRPVLRDERPRRPARHRPPSRRPTAVTNLGFTITPDQLQAAAAAVEEHDAVARTGGAPTLAVGMSEIFSGVPRRRRPEGVLVPLRDHVRGAVHPHHGRRRHPGRPVHAPGHPRQRLEADRPGQLEARPVGHQRRRRRRLGLLPLHRRHQPARRDQPALPAVRHRQPAARRGRADRLHHPADQVRAGSSGPGSPASRSPGTPR